MATLLDTMDRIKTAAQTALETADERRWEAFTTFLHDALAGGAGSLQPLAGSFPAGRELCLSPPGELGDP